MTEQHLKRIALYIKGTVQGVGFRPFIYRLAHQFLMTGFILNNDEGVYIELQGSAHEAFLKALHHDLPALARINTIKSVEIPLNVREIDFKIIESQTSGQHGAMIAPDTAPCISCLQELFDAKSRYYRYPFINCTNCGPRYTIVHQLPYDRSRTAMSSFEMCTACLLAYQSPLDRRYHAEPSACAACGPQLTHSIEAIKGAIETGQMVALKSVGGYQWIVDARQEAALAALRAQKNRAHKPLVVMVLNEASARQYVHLSDKEAELLCAPFRPIVIADKKDTLVDDNIAPYLNTLGMMLANSPVHYLLFHALLGYPSGTQWLTLPNAIKLIVTSANHAEQPMIIDDDVADGQLSTKGTLVVGFNRAILSHADDSIVRCVGSEVLMARRARGYVPKPIKLSRPLPPTLALGGAQKNTVCLVRDDEAFLSVHMGDLTHIEGIERFHEELERFCRLVGVEPSVVAHDAHPDFYTTQLASKMRGTKKAIWHHEAHIAAVIAEKRLEGNYLALALDGYGYGPNGVSSGGELYWVQEGHFIHKGRFAPLALVGGEAAIRKPWRLGAKYLYDLKQFERLAALYSHHPDYPGVRMLLESDMQWPQSHSCGRLFDCAASLLSICHESTYEGEAAIRLMDKVTAPIGKKEGYILTDRGIDFSPLLHALLFCSQEMGANLFHGTLVKGLVDWLNEHKTGDVDGVILSGGCFMNHHLTLGLIQALSAQKMKVFLPTEVPINDAGIALGQAWLANATT